MSGYRKWECVICGFIYDEALGLPDHGIAPGTRWEEVDMDKGTVLRAPSAARPLRFDGEHLPIALVTRYPRVGGCAVVAFPHPADPERAVVRTSTRVVLIERAAR